MKKSVVIKLNGFGFHQWSETVFNSKAGKGKIYGIGHAFVDNQLLNSKDLCELIKNVAEDNGLIIERLCDVVVTLNGNFSIIVQLNNTFYIIADKISSFPLFYGMLSDTYIITDDVRQIDSKVKQKGVSQDEFLAAGFCSGPKTIYKGIYRVQAGEIVFSNNKDDYVERKDYYIHNKNNMYSLKTDLELLETLDNTVSHVFDRLIQYANGRTIVLLLSGGYDSRLVITNLRKHNYEKVICTSFGTDNCRDFLVAKRVAEEMGYKFIPISVDKRYWRNMKNSGELENLLNISASMASLSHFHLGSVAKSLIDSQKVPSDSVFVSGQSGDAIEGDHITGMFKGRDNVNLNEIASVIQRIHYYFQGKKSIKNTAIESEIVNQIRSVGYSDKIYSEDVAEEICECFDWRERQSKFVVSDIRNYDRYLNMDWALPLWDDEFVRFWEKVEYSRYKNRKLYYDYINHYLHEELPTANIESLKRRILNLIKKKTRIIHSPLYFFKALFDYFFSNDYFYAPLGGLATSIFWGALMKGKGFQNNPMMYYTYLIYRDTL